MKSREIALSRLVEAEWNANRVTPSLLAKVRRSIEQFGVVENLVARPHLVPRGRAERLRPGGGVIVARELMEAEVSVEIRAGRGERLRVRPADRALRA